MCQNLVELDIDNLFLHSILLFHWNLYSPHTSIVAQNLLLFVSKIMLKKGVSA
jgi:hypothetical protein